MADGGYEYVILPHMAYFIFQIFSHIPIHSTIPFIFIISLMTIRTIHLSSYPMMQYYTGNSA